MTLSIAIGDFADWSARIRANLDAHYTPDFVDLSVADFDAYDVIIPLARRHAEALGRRPDLKGRKFLHPSPETVALCHDKLALTRFLIAEGFGDFVPPLRAPGATERAGVQRFEQLIGPKRRRHGAARRCSFSSGPRTAFLAQCGRCRWLLRAGRGPLRCCWTFLARLGAAAAPGEERAVAVAEALECYCCCVFFAKLNEDYCVAFLL